MYESLRETWREWGRSIAMADVTPPAWQAADLAVVWLAMALPLPRLLARRGTWLDGVLVAVRLGAARRARPGVPAAGRGVLARSAGRPGRGSPADGLRDPATACLARPELLV